MMKPLVLIFLMTCTLLQAQNSPTDIVKVNTLQNVPVFILNQPVYEYEIVYEAGDFFINNIHTFLNDDIDDKVAHFVNQIKKDCPKQYDAVLYEKGQKAYAIKFKEDLNQDQKKQAKVKKINDVEVYILCEPPSQEFVTITTLSRRSRLSNPLEEDVELFIKKMKRKLSRQDHLDAILYTSGDIAQGIMFE